jgi:hypothetical protein
MARLTLTLTESDLISLLRGEPVQIFHEAPVREVVLERVNLHRVLETAENELRKGTGTTVLPPVLLPPADKGEEPGPGWA